MVRSVWGSARAQGRMRSGVLRLLERLVARGTPVHALGVQAHRWAAEHRFDPRQLQRFLTVPVSCRGAARLIRLS